MEIKIPDKRKSNFLNMVDIARLVSEKLGITRTHLEIVLRETEDTIFDVLLKGYNINFKFGKLKNKYLKPQKGYDGIHKKSIMKQERRIIKFTESTTIRSILKNEKQLNNEKQASVR